MMLGEWLHDLESLEEISQNGDTRRIFLRMAEMQCAGRMSSFLVELARDPQIDDDTKGTLCELAQDVGFLLAVDEYCRRTDTLH
jgi:hypothetical protein